MGRVSFQGVVFEEGFLSAVRTDGAVLRFTRQERALLARLAGQPQRLFTREELFEALGSNGSDRNVDFVINRLRGKLGDTGSERRFISTQYGEGYVWVAPQAKAEEGFLLIGPVRGLRDARTEVLLEGLRAALQERVGAAHKVRLEPDLAGASTAAFRFSLEASFLGGVSLDAALVLRREPTREVAATFRETFAEVTPDHIEALADALMKGIWKHLTFGSHAPAPPDQPLHLRMHDASVLLDPPGVSWMANGQQIARLRAQDQADPVLALMWAMQLFGRMVVAPGPNPITQAMSDPFEDEIERLVLESLPAVRQDPIMALAAAKLLLGVGRGHDALAEELAQAVFTGSAAFAAAFSMMGQIRAHAGDLAEAVRLYDEGLRLCEPGSMFEIYILIHKCAALIAAEDFEGVAVAFQRVLDIQPQVRDQSGLMFLPPDDMGLARILGPHADRADLNQAQRALAYLHFRVARYFRAPGHAANLMRGPLIHLVRRLGPEAATEEVWAAMPAELLYLRAAPAA